MDRASKRVRTDFAPLILQQNIATFPKVYVLHYGQPSTKYWANSPFLMAKCLKYPIGSGYKATKMASGDIQLELKDNEPFKKLAHLIAFGNISVSVSVPLTKNTVKGVVSDETNRTPTPWWVEGPKRNTCAAHHIQTQQHSILYNTPYTHFQLNLFFRRSKPAM